MRKWYPGTEGGPFHLILLALDKIERIPAVLLGLGLVLLAFALGGALGALGAPPEAAWAANLSLIAGIAADWVLLAALPRAGRSFGPVQPPLVMLALLRLLAAAVMTGLAGLAGLPGGWAAVLLAGVQLVGTGLAIYGLWIEPLTLTVTHHKIETPKWPAGAPPLRVLQLADIHMERITARDREVVRRAAELKPDLIVFTGDFINLSYIYDRKSWADLREILSQFHAPLGFYMTTGTPTIDRDDVVPHLVEGLSIRWLRDERAIVGQDGRQIEIVGLACTHLPHHDTPRLAKVMEGASLERFTLLLYHTPDLAPEAAKLGIDLQLSGHTHGGQVRLPFYGAIEASSIYGKRFEMGLKQVDRMQVYVCRGIGLEGKGAPRVRFLCPPEIAVFEIGGTGNRR